MQLTTRRHLLRALEREALSAVRLSMYADVAASDGEVFASQRLLAASSIELAHARYILDALGWIGDLRDNVLASTIGDSTGHGLEYPRFASAARAEGDDDVAALFHLLTADEHEIALALLELLDRNREETRWADDCAA